MADVDICVPPEGEVDLADCYFYHEIDFPEIGPVTGDWRLADIESKYLGGVEFLGKRVLELGPASGLLTTKMDAGGAEVIAYEAHEESLIDLMLPAGTDAGEYANEFKRTLRCLKNAFWFTHRAFGLKATLASGDIYDIPATLGPVDIATFGCILLHLRDPFRALQQALRLTHERVIITEATGAWRTRLTAEWLNRLLGIGRKKASSPVFVMQPSQDTVQNTYWILPPSCMAQMIAVLGFEVERLIFHRQHYKGAPLQLYTLVGRRVAAGMTPLSG